jgi:hypothetical protein
MPTDVMYHISVEDFSINTVLPGFKSHAAVAWVAFRLGGNWSHILNDVTLCVLRSAEPAHVRTKLYNTQRVKVDSGSLLIGFCFPLTALSRSWLCCHDILG